MAQRHEQTPQQGFSLRRLTDGLRKIVRREKSPEDSAEWVESPTGLVMNFFPHADDGIFGRDGYDLANAHYKRMVLEGDILNITLPSGEDEPRTEGVQIRNMQVLYYRPSHAIFGGPQGKHHLLPLPDNPTSEPYIANPSSWEKIGSAPAADLRRAIEKAYSREEVNYEVLKRMGAFDEDSTD